jgi:hypothetical protein
LLLIFCLIVYCFVKKEDRVFSCSAIYSYLAPRVTDVCIGPLTETAAIIQEFGESAVLTARIILGLWNIQRNDQRFAKDGSAAIRIDDILEWRGVQKHSRVASTGAPKRSTDGYQWKHKQEAHRDIKLLELCHLRGYHTIKVQGKVRQIRSDGPYLRVTSVTDTTDAIEENVVGYFVAPGAWINTYEEHGNFFLVEIDRRIFQLHPHNDQIALRIALYLTEHWRQHLKTGRYTDPIIMQELLTASMVPIDQKHLTTRFAPRVEAALTRLIERGIVGEARPLRSLDTTKAHWGKEWLRMPWSILPPVNMNQNVQRDGPTIQQRSLLPAEHHKSPQKQIAAETSGKCQERGVHALAQKCNQVQGKNLTAEAIGPAFSLLVHLYPHAMFRGTPALGLDDTVLKFARQRSFLKTLAIDECLTVLDVAPRTHIRALLKEHFLPRTDPALFSPHDTGSIGQVEDGYSQSIAMGNSTWIRQGLVAGIEQVFFDLAR